MASLGFPRDDAFFYNASGSTITRGMVVELANASTQLVTGDPAMEGNDWGAEVPQNIETIQAAVGVALGSPHAQGIALYDIPTGTSGLIRRRGRCYAAVNEISTDADRTGYSSPLSGGTSGWLEICTVATDRTVAKQLGAIAAATTAGDLRLVYVDFTTNEVGNKLAAV